MVGSGFSQNVTIELPGASTPPGWSDIVRAMHAKLYPSTEPPESEDEPETIVASDALAIAQQYRIAFGRAEVHRFLRHQIRDDEIAPSDFHRRLLSLPWNDVFTTNWDSLLERTADQIPSPTYDVVRETDEIPLASRPRIVKLHGSIPANFPLIVTEEDYRSYPIRFAPYVNTVQQAMMETVFLLVGFSGRDPNFLHWSGWVRDQLGPSAPQIYAAGWLNLSVHERRVLERKNVVPIDLAHHPQARHWEKPNRHRFATDWILRSLELGKPYPAEAWPRVFANPHDPVPEHLRPVDETPWTAPLQEAEFPSSEDNEDPSKVTTKQLSIWVQNRQLYPGWISAPATEIVRVGLTSKRWEPRLLELITDLDPLEQLDAVHEIVWRHEICLDTLSADLAQIARVTLQRALDQGLGSGTRAEAAAGVALALITEARLRLHKEDFDQAIANASNFAEQSPDVANRIHHEKSLWFVYDLDFQALRAELYRWTPTGDPFWAVRKAALMVELGHDRDAQSLLISTIHAMRQRSRGSRSISVRSRESYALYLLNPLKIGLGDHADQSYHSTMREFRRFNCDPEGDIQHLVRHLRRPVRAERGPPFGLGERRMTWPTIHFAEHYVSGAEALRSYAAFPAIRFGEVCGLPPSAGHWSITAHLLSAAAEALYSGGQIELALRVMLRITTYDGDDLLKKLLSRPKLASMPYDLARSLAAICLRVVDDYVTSGTSAPGRDGAVHPVDRLRVAMESLSRFALRLPPDEAADLFMKALTYYANAAIVGHPLIRNAARDLLERTWEALPQSERTRFAFDVLTAPVIGVDGFVIEPFLVTDPGGLIDDGDLVLPERNDQTEAKWRETVRFLIHCLSFDKEARSRAMLRLVNVAMGGRLAQAEVASVARAVWDPERRAIHGLPAEDTLRHWVFLCMPEPKEAIASDWFRDKWLSDKELQATDDDQKVESALFHLGDAKERAYDHDFEFVLTSRDEQRIIELARKWADAPPTEHLLALQFVGAKKIHSLRSAIHGLTTLLLHIEPPQPVLDLIYTKQRRLFDAGVYSMPLLVAIHKHAASRRDAIHATFKKALASDKEDLVYSAVAALQRWLYFEQRRIVTPPPGDLLLEVGFAIATRRTAALGPALWLAQWIYEHGDERDQRALRSLMIEGLEYLFRELDYSQMDLADNEAVPDMRWKCVAIVRAMHNMAYEDSIIQSWIERAREDPLPEVRHTVSSVTL